MKMQSLKTVPLTAAAAAVLAALLAPFPAAGQGVSRKLSAEEIARDLESDRSRPSREHWKSDGYVTMSILRTAPGEVEVHQVMNDMFVVQSGRAAVTIGGVVSGGRDTAPGERRGGAITGGQVTEVGPGDLLWIPAGQPHQVIPQGRDGLRYLVFKTRLAPVIEPK